MFNTIQFSSGIPIPGTCFINQLVRVCPSPSGDSIDVNLSFPANDVKIRYQCCECRAFYDISRYSVLVDCWCYRGRTFPQLPANFLNYQLPGISQRLSNLTVETLTGNWVVQIVQNFVYFNHSTFCLDVFFFPLSVYLAASVSRSKANLLAIPNFLSQVSRGLQ